MKELENKSIINKDELNVYSLTYLLTKEFCLAGHFEKIKKISDNKFIVVLSENNESVSFEIDLNNTKENIICKIDNSPFFYIKLIFDKDYNGSDKNNTIISINQFMNNKISRMSFSLDDNKIINEFAISFIELVIKRNSKLLDTLMKIKKYYNKRTGDNNEKAFENAN